MSDTAVIPRITAQALAACDHIDIIVNNAGIIRRQDAIEFSEKNWYDVMNLNIKSLFLSPGRRPVNLLNRDTVGK